jgi:Raf kinase inhibitor-like YbhB/YbcL family protein
VKRNNILCRVLSLGFVLILFSTSCSSKPTAEPTQVPLPTSASVEASATSPAAPMEPTIAPPTEALPTEEPWEVLFQDDFEDTNSGWESYREFDGVLDYEEGGYRMWVDVPENLFWVNANQEYSDVRVEVDAKVIDGPEANQFGVMCRLDSETFDYYFFLISSEGTYLIGKQTEWAIEYLAESSEPSDVIRKDFQETNHIRADCEEDILRLFVNDELLLEVQDPDLEEGDVGLAVGTVGESGVDVMFDNFTLYGPEGVQEGGETMPLQITSAAFVNEDPIPMGFSCDGDDISPPLQWTNAPEGTQSYALIVDDPDAPGGTWVHWVLYNIPADIETLGEAIPEGAELADGSLHGVNSWGQMAYGGPCPPSGTHRYFFKLYALDSMLDLDSGVDVETLLQAMEGHILAQAELMGTYSR